MILLIDWNFNVKLERNFLLKYSVFFCVEISV